MKNASLSEKVLGALAAVLLAVMGFLFNQLSSVQAELAEVRTVQERHTQQFVNDVDFWWNDEWKAWRPRIVANESDVRYLTSRVEDMTKLWESPLVVDAIQLAHEHTDCD